MKNPAWRVIGVGLFALKAAGGEGLPDLLPPHAELPPTYWDQHGWQIIAAGIVVFAVVVLLIVFLCTRRRKPPVLPPPAMRARRELEALRGSTEDGTLLVKVSGIFRDYVLCVCGLPPAELTTAEVREVIQASPRFNPGLASDINGFLRQCDERKFAPAPPAPTTGVVTAALALIDQVELGRNPPADASAPQPAASATAP
jgi:Domain of unknown function (DUF4381)